MLELIQENKFEELRESLINSTDFKIHKFLSDIIDNKIVEIDGESFDATQYQEEFLEGLEIYKALLISSFDRKRLKGFSNILVELAFKMSEFIQVMATTAMNKGVYLSDLESLYKVNPNIREKLQEFIELLKGVEGEEKSVANVCVAKSKVSNSVSNVLEKYEIGEDMLQFAQSYENIDQKEMAARIYQTVMKDFEANSVQLSSGLFPEISHLDDRAKNEVEIYKRAENSFKKLVEHFIEQTKDSPGDKSDKSKTKHQAAKTAALSFFSRLKNIFKKN